MNKSDQSRWKTTRNRAELRKGRNNWFEVHNAVKTAEGTRTRIDINDEIGFFGVTARDLASKVNAIDSDVIELHINSPGGDVFDGITLHNLFRDHPSRVETTVDGQASSIASVIAIAGDHVTMNRGSMMVVHLGHGLAIGNAKDLRDHADLIDQASDTVSEFYAAKSGQTAARWLQLMTETTRLTAQQAVDEGLADVAVEAGAAVDNSYDLSIYGEIHDLETSVANVTDGGSSTTVSDAGTIEGDTPGRFDAEAFAAAMKERTR